MTSGLYPKPRSMTPNIKLHNGVEMPLIGQGTYPMAGETLYNALKNALDCGCTLFDTAHSYPNMEVEKGFLSQLYLFEFKLDGSARQALDQINERDYPLPFRTDGRKLFRIGTNFSSKLRSIESWLIETDDCHN